MRFNALPYIRNAGLFLLPTVMDYTHLQSKNSVTTCSFRVPPHTEPLRLDQALAQYVPDLSREAARKFIQHGAVWINNKRVQIQSRKIFPGDAVTLYTGREGYRRYYDIDPNNILYQDEYLLFYRKEPGIPSQAIVCDNYNNIYAALQRYLKVTSSMQYLGLHHRLDLETSGVMIFTRSPAVNRSIHYQFRDHQIKKSYLALVAGPLAWSEQALTSYISRRDSRYCCSETGPGKVARCRFTKLHERRDCTLLRAEPSTGRTHQIRLQLAFVGHPVLGDPLYGSGHTEQAPRTMLHAESLSITHPVHKKLLTVTADLFDDMQQLIMADAGNCT
jgi:23S rRNA pseudouridine1911/1915/1917 synthase